MRWMIFCLMLFLMACHKKHTHPHILIVTNYGDIEAELYEDKAPQTVAAFIRNIQLSHYKNSTFYRVLKDDDMPTDYNTGIIQGGVWPQQVTAASIPHESTQQTGLSHTSGTLSMARLAAGSASTEFFICVGDKTSLDFGKRGTKDSLGYAAFGKVVDGMDVVRKIHAQKSAGENFIKKINITDIKLN